MISALMILSLQPFDFSNFLDFTFKHQNTGYFKAPLRYIRGISPVPCQKQKTWSKYLPQQMTYNHSIFNNSHRMSVAFISRFLLHGSSSPIAAFQMLICDWIGDNPSSTHTRRSYTFHHYTIAVHTS